ncbi:MAG: methionyl-tRNA formyltransferase [Kiritimatiellaeota bacterium]|nr:methionyl-tRNA formyltransferase [Kiritimatiellota bacterium]
MRIVFMGAGELGCPALAALFKDERDEVVGVVTQPDRPRGRRLQLAACPVKQALVGQTVPVLTPEKVGDPAFVEQLRALRPDAIVVAAYGQFLPRVLLDLPPHGVLNIHPSLLPKYRGAAPVQWTLANGEKETGVSIIALTEKMDAGDILAQGRLPIGAEDNAATLTHKLAWLGAELALRVIEDVRTGTVRRTPQDERLATRAPLLKKEDGRLDWALPAATLHNRIRGFFPWPGNFFEYPCGSGKYVKVLRAALAAGAGVPGTVLQADAQGLVLAAGQGALRLLDVQPEGRTPQPAAAFVNGARLLAGYVAG